MVSVWHSPSITRGFLDLLCSTTIGSVVRAIRVLRPFRKSTVGEVDRDMTVFRAVMCWSGMSHLGGWWTTWGLWTTAGLEGVGGEYKSLVVEVESCLLRQEPVGVGLTMLDSRLSREYRLSLSLPLYEGLESKLDEDVRLSSKPCLETQREAKDERGLLISSYGLPLATQPWMRAFSSKFKDNWMVGLRAYFWLEVQPRNLTEIGMLSLLSTASTFTLLGSEFFNTPENNNIVWKKPKK